MQSIDLLVESTREFLHDLAQFIPHLVLALAIVLVGWLLAKACRFAVEKALRAINFNVLTERAGTDHFLRQGGLRGDTTTLFGLLAYWLVIVAALIIACNALSLAYVSELLQRIILYAPRLLIALLLLVLGSYFARFVAGAVATYCLEVDIPDADLLGKISQYLIMAFVIMIALGQLDVGGDLVQLTFLVLLAGVVLALALAFGLGGREWAAAMLERWWPRERHKDES